MSTLLLDRTTWDLVLDAAGNIAVADEPYALAQDAASAIQLWLGEAYLDTTVGVDWKSILGQQPNLALLKQKMVDAAKTVPDVADATCFVTSLGDRRVAGQVQVVSKSTGQASAASFQVANPQGVG
jgi:hypothetical protein